MKYNPDAYLEYPILRPNSSDYPSGELITRLSLQHIGDKLGIELAFEVNEPSIRKQIEKTDTVCCALVYCSTTCYSEMIRADSGATHISASVPLSYLKGRVELHPSLITLDDLDRSFQYRSRQLAMDEEQSDS